MNETYDIVDRDDNIIKTGILEEELHVNNDIMRVVTIHISDAQGRYYIAQRSPDKKIDPLKFEAPAHGRVNSWEEYETAAHREVFEELGVSELELKEIGYYYVSFHTNVWIRQYWKKLYISRCEALWYIDRSEIYDIKSFNSLEKLMEYYENNTDKFSNAIALDIPYIKEYLSKK